MVPFACSHYRHGTSTSANRLYIRHYILIHCNFSRVCLLIKMASKTVTRSIQSPYCSVFIIENVYRQYMIGDRRTGLNIGCVESTSGNATPANKTRKIKPAYLKSKKKKANEKWLIKARQTIMLNASCLCEVPTPSSTASHFPQTLSLF